MQLTVATDYAFRAVGHLTLSKLDTIIPAQVIAENEEIPRRFLLKIMRSLVDTGIIKSHRGAEGGFSLAKSADQITLLAVVEAVEGPIRINRCLIHPEYCSKKFSDKCPVHSTLADLQTMIRSKLGSTTFADLLLKPSKQ